MVPPVTPNLAYLRQVTDDLEAARSRATTTSEAIRARLPGDLGTLQRMLGTGAMAGSDLVRYLTPAVGVLIRAFDTLQPAVDTAFAPELSALRRQLPPVEPSLPRRYRFTDGGRWTMTSALTNYRRSQQLYAPDCSWHAAMNAIGHKAPRLVTRAVQRDTARGLVTVRTANDEYELLDTLPVTRLTGRPVYGQSGGSAVTPFIQKAWAMHRGSFQNVKAAADEVLAWFTGEHAWRHAIAEMSDDQLAALVDDPAHPVVFILQAPPRPFTIVSLPDYLRNLGLRRRHGLERQGRHAYSAYGTDGAGSFVLHDPRDEHPLEPVPASVVRTLFSWVYWSGVPSDTRERPS